jgi:hypothetical protein
MNIDPGSYHAALSSFMRPVVMTLTFILRDSSEVSEIILMRVVPKLRPDATKVLQGNIVRRLRTGFLRHSLGNSVLLLSAAEDLDSSVLFGKGLPRRFRGLVVFDSHVGDVIC